MTDQITHHDDGLVGEFFQSTLRYGATEIVSRIDFGRVAASQDAVALRLADDLRALKAAGVPAGLPVISTATAGVIAVSK